MTKKHIDDATVKHIAKLSRLKLSEEEIGDYSEKLSVILEYIDNLNKLDIEGVEPTSHVVSNVRNVFREDKVTGSIPVEEVLKNAPKRIKEFFGVP